MLKTSILLLVALVFRAVLIGQTASANEQLSNGNAITNPYRSDGFGAQFQTIIFSVIYAEFHGCKFLYTPFRNMEHNYDNDPQFLEKIEHLINFIGNFEINENWDLQPSNHSNFHQFFESNLNECANSDSLKKIKEAFRLNKKKTDYFGNENLNIAIHIRRPNPHDIRSEGTDIPDKVYLKIIKFLRKKYFLKTPQFHIYSQGDIKDFKKRFGFYDTVLHINESLETTFASMVFADVLVTSASSLSYVAGILSEGTVYYIPFWHPPLPHWIVTSRE